MKQITRTKTLRKVLILTFLIAGLIIVAVDRSNCVEAGTCDDRMYEFHNAMATYDIALRSYYYGSPTTCQEDCQGITDPTARQQCIDDCRTTRRTTLAQADLDLFAAAGATCTPLTIEECSQAQSMADQCLAQYYYPDYFSNPEEFDYIYTQYSACREASKIDSCQ